METSTNGNVRWKFWLLQASSLKPAWCLHVTRVELTHQFQSSSSKVELCFQRNFWGITRHEFISIVLFVQYIWLWSLLSSLYDIFLIITSLRWKQAKRFFSPLSSYVFISYANTRRKLCMYVCDEDASQVTYLVEFQKRKLNPKNDEDEKYIWTVMIG